MGAVTSYLFGIATNDELDACFNDYERFLSSVVTDIKGTFYTVHSTSDTINSLYNVTRTLAICTKQTNS